MRFDIEEKCFIGDGMIEEGDYRVAMYFPQNLRFSKQGDSQIIDCYDDKGKVSQTSHRVRFFDFEDSGTLLIQPVSLQILRSVDNGKTSWIWKGQKHQVGTRQEDNI